MSSRPDCPTDDELAGLREAEPGTAPDELARHVASCDRCQQRLLFGAVRPAGARRAASAPPLRRMIGFVALLLAAVALLAWSMLRLAAR